MEKQGRQICGTPEAISGECLCNVSCELKFKSCSLKSNLLLVPVTS